MPSHDLAPDGGAHHTGKLLFIAGAVAVHARVQVRVVEEPQEAVGHVCKSHRIIPDDVKADLPGVRHVGVEDLRSSTHGGSPDRIGRRVDNFEHEFAVTVQPVIGGEPHHNRESLRGVLLLLGVHLQLVLRKGHRVHLLQLVHNPPHPLALEYLGRVRQPWGRRWLRPPTRGPQVWWQWRRRWRRRRAAAHHAGTLQPHFREAACIARAPHANPLADAHRDNVWLRAPAGNGRAGEGVVRSLVERRLRP
mmetsp:Transcript_17345/g.48779  ORF Transcript_17345/g.48779 Transcript_17345/m.48779 type:complete len:249 (+) Transcript_17345:663-1409(+)